MSQLSILIKVKFRIPFQSKQYAVIMLWMRSKQIRVNVKMQAILMLHHAVIGCHARLSSLLTGWTPFLDFQWIHCDLYICTACNCSNLVTLETTLVTTISVCLAFRYQWMFKREKSQEDDSEIKSIPIESKLIRMLW